MTAAAKDDPALGAQPVALNQVGFETAKPKRFTAPKAADGTKFSVRAADGGEALFTGEVRGGIGRFQRIPAGGLAHTFCRRVGHRSQGHQRSVSDPLNLYKEQFWQPRWIFSLIRVRPSERTRVLTEVARGAMARITTPFIPALTLFYLADPKRVEAMPRQIDWEADKKRVTSPDFAFNDKDPGAKGFMNSVRAYYELEPPAADAPDVVKLIHWGAGFYLVNPKPRIPRKIRTNGRSTRRPSSNWPTSSGRGRRSNNGCRSRSTTKRATLFSRTGARRLKSARGGIPRPTSPPKISPKAIRWAACCIPTKDGTRPGHSIVPNLLMHEVAKREGRDDAASTSMPPSSRRSGA
jgi:hypothetical protein